MQKVDTDELIKDWVASPPKVYFQLRTLLDDPRASFGDFAKVIKRDPALMAKLLKIVNSPLYSVEEEVDTIEHAINIVGTDQLSDLSLASSVATQFDKIPKRLINPVSFWRHGMATGITAKALAKQKGIKDYDYYYVAGMLHNLGSLILFQKFPDKSAQVLERCRESKLSLSKVEMEVFGTCHEKVGGALLRRWGLPLKFVEPALFHHEPTKSKEFPITTSIIHVADILTRTLKLGDSGEPNIPPYDPMVMRVLKLNDEKLKEIEETVKNDFYDEIFFNKDSVLY
ncbi:MAG: HDOD domain-containing protein [Candidatus Nitrohelix vancouverensis]|uniref:HDOD domain-containing protein n=1 Tax=Candidatus Nitrohelix vancouverensis TaxID=2705534 RepID=A0A7T0G379_9BACT|nr:MAG: HDOD domain-containing protein [Candidatus Nitrohelix vancouverensis]